MKKTRYINPEYINLFPDKKRDYLATKQEKTELYNRGLIALRVAFRKFADNDKRLAFKMLHFNKLVKTKYQSDVVSVIKMYLNS